MGTQGVNATTLVEKKAAAVRVFTDAVTVLIGIEVLGRKAGDAQLKMSGQRVDLFGRDIDRTGRAGTTLAAPEALKL